MLNGKESVMVFFLDKDVDDIKRRNCRSPHVIYTLYYDVQNYLFRHGDFVRSVSAAASIDPCELQQHTLFGSEWCLTAAKRWRDWIVFCLFSVIYCGGRGTNYRSASRVNEPLNGPVSLALYQAYSDEARYLSGFSPLQFDQAISKLRNKVDAHLSNKTHDKIFKGKWYSTILEMDLRNAFPGGAMRHVGVNTANVLLATIDLEQDWATHLRRATANLLDPPNAD